jgi:hypothetical protein
VFLANDLNSNLGRSFGLFRENSALIFLRVSQDTAVEAHCTVEGAATDRFGGPPINRETRGRVDPIPLRLPPPQLLSLPSLSLFSLSCHSDLATTVSSRPLTQLPTPTSPELAPPLHAVLAHAH